MCSQHVEAWNKLNVKQQFLASSWLITEINILRCTVSKTLKSKFVSRLLRSDTQMDKQGEANTLHFAIFRRDRDETMHLEWVHQTPENIFRIRVYPPYPHSGMHPCNQHCPAVTGAWQVTSESSNNHFHRYTFWYTCVLWHFETAHLDVRSWHKDSEIALHSSVQAWDCYVTCWQGQACLNGGRQYV